MWKALDNIPTVSQMSHRYVSSLRVSSPIWASETSLARTRVLPRLASLAQIGELARRLICQMIQMIQTSAHLIDHSEGVVFELV